MRFIQFYNMSTGYIKGTIPPKFSDENKKPIPACGSNSVYKCDGRWSLSTMHRVAKEEAKKRGFIGYSIESVSFLNHSTIWGFTAI